MKHIVKAIIVGRDHTTFYLEDGSKKVIPQGSAGLEELITSGIEQISVSGSAELNLDIIESSYEQFQETTKEVIRFFQIAKSLVQILMDAVDSVDKEKLENLLQQHSKPISINSTPTDETVVAVVNGNIVPSVEKVENQIARACSTGSTKGMEAFLKRAASVSKERQHSVEDLMTFVQKSDLPIAEDGCIIAYKILKQSDKGFFVDKHTSRVKQAVGDLVTINPSLVDTDRNVECSAGLHIARRSYISTFYSPGDKCTLIKLAPEDVITVPHNDPNKVRVLGYHILAELSEDMIQNLYHNYPITNCEGGVDLLDKAIQGDFPEPEYKVTVNGDMGRDVVREKIVYKKTKPNHKEEKKTISKAAKPMNDDGIEYVGTVVDPNEVVKKVAVSQKDLAQALYKKVLDGDAEAKKLLQELKKRSKKSYAALGITDYNGE